MMDFAIMCFSVAFFVFLIFEEIYPRRSMVKETTGTITMLASVHRFTYIAYTVNDKRYEQCLNNRFTPLFLKEGQQIRIYYDPADPSKIRSDTSIFLFLFVGAFYTGIPIFIIARNFIAN